MPVGLKVTAELFTQIKNELKYSDPTTVAIKNHMSIKTILQVKGSQTYADYVAQKRAQHPPQTFSMRTLLEELNRKVDILIEVNRENKLAL